MGTPRNMDLTVRMRTLATAGSHGPLAELVRYGAFFCAAVAFLFGLACGLFALLSRQRRAPGVG
ncbi:hypothetical protein [Nocardioides sp. Kera G14]|uniref:hypothetical protein n=1 Tax=Nocardioides sp. Kera G14 TaxID=2884264 RepID=UPI001D12DCCD|nr:hypothetical protein [Nocardioides sp. Kera G14]UDY23775.1 hypothetical protein LH076_00310 [Nocardioides sp. Kera G14]